MKKKYICYSGYVYSPNDGDKHWIQAKELPQLYGVRGAECFFIKTNREEGRLDGMKKEDYICLHPRSKGDYKEHLAGLTRLHEQKNPLI